MIDEIYRRDHAADAHLAAVRRENFTPKNLSAAAYLSGEDAFRYLETQIWRLERARVLHIEQFEKLVRARGAEDAEAILSDYPRHVARDVDFRRAALALASARLRVSAAALNSVWVCQVDPNSVVAFELNHIDDLLADIVRALPYAVEAVEWRALPAGLGGLPARWRRLAEGLSRCGAGKIPPRWVRVSACLCVW